MKQSCFSLLPAVILETLGITMNKFAVTRKDGAHNDRSYQIKQIIPHLILAVLYNRYRQLHSLDI